jgi:hypothetical protein
VGQGELHTSIPSLRYGHCTLSAAGVLAAFAWLVYNVEKRPLTGVEQVLPDAASLEEYLDLVQIYQLLPLE